MGCEVVCWAEPTVVNGLWLVKERELSGEFSPSDKRWATPNSSGSNNNQWSKSMTHSSCIVSTVGAPAGSSAGIQPPSWRNQILIYPMSPYMLASSRGHWDKLILVLQSSKEACRYANDDLPPVCGSCPVPGVILLLLLFLRRIVPINSRIQTDEVPRAKSIWKEFLEARPQWKEQTSHDRGGWGSWQRKEIGENRSTVS